MRKEIYVEKLPDCCINCICCHTEYDGVNYCYAWDNEEHWIRDNIYDKGRMEDCPLKSLHDHDKELVARVLKEVEDTFTQYLPLRNRTGAWFYGRLNEILKKYQKEFEDGK